MKFPFSDPNKAKRKSRKGAMPANVETLMKQDRCSKGGAKLSSLQFQAFAQALKEKLAIVSTPQPVSREQAREAAKTLRKPKSMRRHVEIAGISGAATPLIAGASRAAKGFADTKGGLKARLAGAAKEVGTATLGDVASQAVGGGLTGGVLSASREGLQTRKARKQLDAYLAQRRFRRSQR